MIKNNNVLNAQEAADFLSAHVETVRRLARKGEIPSYKIGKDWRFRKEALTKWAETHHLRRKSSFVLVIDDEDRVCKLMRHFLEAEGYRVCLASDGAGGLAWLNRESVNLVILDLKMPGMNGPEFLKEMRKMNEYLPVIIVTGYPDGGLMAKALRHGPFTLLAKPIDREQLMQAVRTALKGVSETQIHG